MAVGDSETPWESLAQVVQQPKLGLRQVFPLPLRQLSLLDALREPTLSATEDGQRAAQQLGQQLSDLLGQLQVSATVSRCPILAIAGLLNAGKSSLLATYLSAENRSRVLRGVGNHSGTHRFVLWLPKLWWDTPHLYTTLIALITNLFGHAPELLAEDPRVAAEQYNGRVIEAADGRDPGDAAVIKPIDALAVPLIAYDQNLNQLQLGLLDCPDIQTGFLSPADRTLPPDQLAGVRQAHLARMGKLCSAFVVVSKLSNLHDSGLLQILTTLRDAMPGVPRILAVNKIKARYAPETVAAETRGLVDRFGIESVFGAYDYRSSLAQTRVPPPPAQMLKTEEPQPIFFKLGTTVDRKHQPEYLFDLAQTLAPGRLAEASLHSLQLQLSNQLSRSLDWLETNQQFRQQQISDAWQAIAEACYEFMAERDAQGRATGLRLQASPAIVAQMADSLQRTAPRWMRASLSIDRTARQFHQAISDSAARFKLWKSASDTVAQYARKFRYGEGAQVVTPQRLAESLRQTDRHGSLEHVEIERLISASDLAMQRFSKENQSLLDAAELERWSEQVWRDMSWRDKLWKGTQPLAVLMAPLLAVVLVPFDGGGSAVLVFASVKELLAAAGVAALLGPAATGGEALSIIHRETPWRQLGDLFAICCDAFGLPRPASAAAMPRVKCAGVPRPLPMSQVETKSAMTPPAVFQWELVPETILQLRGRLRS